MKAELDNRALANRLGINYDAIASDGEAVMDHLTAQTAATGSASVPPGTHLSGDGNSVNIPKESADARRAEANVLNTGRGVCSTTATTQRTVCSPATDDRRPMLLPKVSPITKQTYPLSTPLLPV